MAKSPANTSHFLQVCDNDVNLRVNRGVQKSHDTFLKALHNIAKTIPLNLMACVAGHEEITAIDMHKYWDETALWPVDFRFLSFYPETTQEKSERVAKDIVRENQRQSDVSVYMKMRSALELHDEKLFGVPTQEDALKSIEKLSAILRDRTTTHSILNKRAEQFAKVGEEAKQQKDAARLKSYVLN